MSYNKREFAALRALQYVCSTEVKNIPLCPLNQSKPHCCASWKYFHCALWTKQNTVGRITYLIFFPALIKISSLPSKALIFVHFQFSFKTKDDKGSFCSLFLPSRPRAWIAAVIWAVMPWTKALRDNAQWLFSIHQTLHPDPLLSFSLIVSHLSGPL